MIPSTSGQRTSRTPSPADHVRTLVELLHPAGPDLARRLVAALLLAPREEREAIVSSIEAKMVELYASERGDASLEDGVAEAADLIDGQPRTMSVIDPPVQRDGFVEQLIHTYEVSEDASGVETPGPVKERSSKAG